MTVTFVEENKGTEFKSLAIGDVFVEVEYPEAVYIKIDEISNEFEMVNAVCLRSGSTVWMNTNVKVELVEAELVVAR